jgi:hypothetical protein
LTIRRELQNAAGFGVGDEDVAVGVLLPKYSMDGFSLFVKGSYGNLIAERYILIK